MDNPPVENLPVLVTGATGHTGRRLVHALLERSYKVRVLTREPARMDVKLRRQVEVLRGDITDPEAALKAVTGCRAVVALTHIKYAAPLITAMKSSGVSRGIFISSTRRFTKFVEQTARQVIEGERTVETSGLDWTIIRASMIYGGRQDRNLQPLLNTLKKWPAFPLPGGGKMLWQPVFTWDVIAAILAALERPVSIGKAYTVAGPEPVSYRQMIEIMLAEAGIKRPLIPLPLGLLRPLVSYYERHSRNPRIQMDQIRRMEEDKTFDISDAIRDLDFKPVSFTEGIRRKIRGDA